MPYIIGVPLAHALTEHNIEFTRTSNKNRAELPEICQLSTLRCGEVIAYHTPKLLALAWQAEKKKKPVFMVSDSAAMKFPQLACTKATSC